MERLRRFPEDLQLYVNSIYVTITLYDPTQKRYAYTESRWLCANENSLDMPVKVLSIYRVISRYNREVYVRGRDISRFLSVL